jgi:glycosyltransferase involved in cell wall biosynthesis
MASDAMGNRATREAMVSIITPVYNGSEFIAHTVESVLQQTHTAWNLICVDDGSTDDSLEIVNGYAEMDSRVRVVRQKNRGICGARNRGLLEMSGDSEFVVFLDHDDVLYPRMLETLVKRLNEHPDALAAHGIASLIDGAGLPVKSEWYHRAQRERVVLLKIDGEWRLVPSSLEEPTTFNAVLASYMMHPPGKGMVRRDAFALPGLKGGFDPYAELAEDWDFWLRVSRNGAIQFVPEEVMSYRVHKMNASRSRRQLKRIEYVRRKAMASSDNSGEQAELLQAIWQLDNRHALNEHVRQCFNNVRDCRMLAAAVSACRVVNGIRRRVFVPVVRKRSAGSVCEA